jgi:hypothetical protein
MTDMNKILAQLLGSGAAGGFAGGLAGRVASNMLTSKSGQGWPPKTRRCWWPKMGRPIDMNAIIDSASCPEVAAEIYIASLLAIDVGNPAEQSYRSMLAARLNIPPDLTTELRRQVEAQTVS